MGEYNKINSIESFIWIKEMFKHQKVSINIMHSFSLGEDKIGD